MAVETAGTLPDVKQAVIRHKQAFTRRLIDTAQEAGAADPESLGRQLAVLFEGAKALTTSLNDARRPRRPRSRGRSDRRLQLSQLPPRPTTGRAKSLPALSRLEAASTQKAPICATPIAGHYNANLCQNGGYFACWGPVSNAKRDCQSCV